MALFWADSIVLYYADVEAAKHWWINTFDCSQPRTHPDWDIPLPSDVALILSGAAEPTVLLCSRSEAQEKGLTPRAIVPVIFCKKIEKVHELLQSRGVFAGPIQADSETKFFSIRDPEGNEIEVCKEP